MIRHAKYSVALALLGACGVATADSIVGNNVPNVTYNYVTGQLAINPDGFQLQTLFLGLNDVNDILSVVSDIDGAGGQSWQYQGFIGGMSWETAAFGPDNFTSSGDLVLGQLVEGLGDADFGPVVPGAPNGSIAETTVTVVPEPSSLALLGLAGLVGLRRRS